MTREEIASLFARRQDAMARHDVAALTALFTEDCVVESPLAAGTVQGRAANAQVYRAFFEAFPDATFNVGELVVDGDSVVQIGTLTGTDTGGLMGMVPSGKAAVIPMVISPARPCRSS
jgi:predicted ester cyclase